MDDSAGLAIRVAPEAAGGRRRQRVVRHRQRALRGAAEKQQA